MCVFVLFTNHNLLFCRAGIIQPSRVGPDGKPQPIEHVLELTEGIDPTPQSAGDGNDSD